MIQSMTGFVSTEGAWQDRRVQFELKSLNHRHLESKWKLPRELSHIEPMLRDLVAKMFGRGYFDGKLEWIRDAQQAAPETLRTVNIPRAAQYLDEIKSLQLKLGLVDPITTRDLLNLPDVIDRPNAPAAFEGSWDTLKPWIETALKSLAAVRSNEGDAMAHALRDGLTKIRTHAQVIARQREVHLKRVHALAKERVHAILGREATEERVFAEAALTIDRTDIAEELARVASHLDFFEGTLNAGGAVGRKLEFIVQELNRECNTLSSKAQDFEISQHAVEIKVALEQLRELVLNLE
jgi:uncharacterized protein (TIGR00255 family)